MTIFLIRHSTAGKRSGAPDDINRELNDKGRIQAKRIAEHLAKAGIETILSSPATRCVQTVTPLATQLDSHVEVNQALWEDESPRAIISLMQRLVRGDSTAALCSHGNLIPAVLDLLAADGTDVRGSSCAKGSIWTLTVSDTSITEARYFAP